MSVRFAAVAWEVAEESASSWPTRSLTAAKLTDVAPSAAASAAPSPPRLAPVTPRSTGWTCPRESPSAPEIRSALSTSGTLDSVSEASASTVLALESSWSRALAVRVAMESSACLVSASLK